MHRIQGWTGLRAAVIALGLVAWTATGATAAPLTYTTSVQVTPDTGVTGNNVISFVPNLVPTSSNTVDLSSGESNVSLGNFVIAPLAAGATTTYSNSPIQISFQPQSNGGTDVSGDVPVVVKGVLNGEVSGPSSSTVVATFDPPSNSLIGLGGNGTANFSLPAGSLLLAPSTSNGGTTSAQGLVTLSGSTESPVPEPSTIALFLTTVGGLGLRRYVLSRRRPARA